MSSLSLAWTTKHVGLIQRFFGLIDLTKIEHGDPQVEINTEISSIEFSSFIQLVNCFFKFIQAYIDDTESKMRRCRFRIDLQSLLQNSDALCEIVVLNEEQT